MIAAIILAAASATASPSPAATSIPSPPPAASASSGPTLPGIERALALPYPAYGLAQPQVITTRRSVDVPTAITVDAAIAIAIDRVPSLHAARAQVAFEAAAVQSARTAGAPSLSIAASSSGTYNQGGVTTGASTTGTVTAAAGPLSTYSQSNAASLSLSQLIYDGGQIRAKIDAASLTRDATLATYRRDTQTVAYNVSVAYYQVLQDERAVENVVLREASDAVLHRSLLASAAIPIIFNPVVLPMVDGTDGAYVDGSIASNAIVEIARTVAKNIHVVLVDAPSRRTTYANAVAVAVGGYATMQREIVEVAMRDVYQQSEVNRSLHGLELASTIERRSTSSEVQTMLRDVPIVELAYVRPQSELPVGLTAFKEQRQLDRTFAIGERDAVTGFTPYQWETFRL